MIAISLLIKNSLGRFMTARQPFQILVPAKTTLEDASLQQASTQTDKQGEYRGIEGTTFVGRHEKNA